MTLAIQNALPPTGPDSLAQIRDMEAKMMQLPQVEPEMHHVLHAGMYARTARLLPGHVIVGVVIKIPTIVIVNGKCAVYAADRWHAISGYQVIPALAGRKQVFVTFGATEITMLFPTEAQTVEEAEAEFTDEAEQLLSRRRACQE